MKLIIPIYSRIVTSIVTSKIASNRAELLDAEIYVSPPPETGNTSSPETDETVKEPAQISEPREVK